MRRAMRHAPCSYPHRSLRHSNAAPLRRRNPCRMCAPAKFRTLPSLCAHRVPCLLSGWCFLYRGGEFLAPDVRMTSPLYPWWTNYRPPRSGSEGRSPERRRGGPVIWSLINTRTLNNPRITELSPYVSICMGSIRNRPLSGPVSPKKPCKL